MFFTKRSATILIVLHCLILLTIKTHAWDRYSNETEWTIASGASAEHIVRYNFTLTTTSNCDFYTDELTTNSDTYMHLWSHTANREVCRNDDGQVPSGNIWASRITTTLPPGDYTLYIRAYNVEHIGYVEPYELRRGRCNLYRNGSLVLSNQKFGGHQLSLGTWEGTRLRTINVPSGKDTYILLLAGDDEMVGWDDDDGDGLASSIIDGPQERQNTSIPKLIVGAFDEGTECICDVGCTEDWTFEFLSLCGPEQRNVESGARFTEFMGPITHNPSYSTTVSSYAYMFQGQRLSNTDYGIDNVDLIWIHSHGAPGYIEMRDGGGIYITGSSSSCGSGNRSHNMIGDLEYMALLTCETVKIKHTQSFDWLETDGWKSTATSKGLFEGLHYVVGYHSSHSNTDDSYKHEGSTFACRLRDGKSIWQAWRETNEYVSDKYSGWFHSFSPGMASAICLNDQKDETIAGHCSKDIIFGYPNYLFTVWWYGTGSAPPN